MPIEALLQALLVNGMPNHPDGAAEREEAVQHPQFNRFIEFLFRKVGAGTQQVQKQYADAAIDIQDERVAF